MATPSILKNIMGLRFFVGDPKNLSSGVHPFVLVQHTISTKNSLVELAETHKSLASGSIYPTLQDSQILMDPDRATILGYLSLSHVKFLHMAALVDSNLGRGRPVTI